jgi:hypothetical protein
MALAIDTLVYAKRLREAGFSEQQAEGQAHALAAAMTDALATKQDLRELEVRMEARFAAVDARFTYIERHLDTRFAEVSARFHGELANLERRVTLRLGGMIVAGVGVLSVLVTLF